MISINKKEEIKLASNTVSGVLIQAEVNFTVMVDTFVDWKTYNDEEKLREKLIELAQKNLDNSVEDVDFINERNVVVSIDTATKYDLTMIGDVWKDIIAESDKLED